MNQTQYECPNALLLVSFPHQLLHVLSALTYARGQAGIAQTAPATILLWSYHAAQHAAGSNFRDFFSRALKSFPHVTLLMPSLFERRYHLSPYRLIADRVQWLAKKLEPYRFGSCYFPHDASADRTAQVVMQTFPAARRICYGDSPGFLYGPDGGPDAQRIPSKPIKQLFWKTRWRGVDRCYAPDESIIAVDFREREQFEQDTRVRVLPQTVLSDTLKTLQSAWLEPLSGLPASLRRQLGSTYYLLLMSNLHESGLTSQEQERALYLDICTRTIPSDAPILIKPHVGSHPAFVNQLIGALGQRRLAVLPKFARMLPVEYLQGMLPEARIVSVSSSSALIARLFAKPVIHALTQARIEEFFLPYCVPYMRAANRSIEQAVERLDCNATDEHRQALRSIAQCAEKVS